MMKILALLLAVTILAGCSFITTPKEKESLAMDIEEISARTAAVERKQNALAFEFEAIKTDIGKLRANVSADVSALREEMRAIKGGAEEKEYDIKRISESTDVIKNALQSIEERLGRVEARPEKEAQITALRTEIEELKNSVALPSGNTGKREPIAKEDKKQVDPKALYEEALAATRKEKDYEKGLEGFSRFLSLYPKHELADNAQYWIGEIYYAKKEWEQAIVEFNKAVKQHPGGDKVPSALLKQAYAFEKLGSKAEAEVVFNMLIEKYPKSEEAVSAKAHLKKSKK
ncbi:MAG: tol-pal system protein YbgF [Thermodesulfobacteriota bacterium]